MDVLISGAGIAGPTLAWWIVRQGHTVTMVEKASAPRTGGYVIDFWGKGYELAERMGLLGQIEAVGYKVREVRLLASDGHKVGGFPATVFDRATQGNFTSLPRGELARILNAAVAGDVETLFGQEVTALSEDAGGVDVTLSNGETRRVDLVVGCEGIHSQVRDLVFGPEQQFERYLGYAFAALILPDFPVRDEDVYLLHGVPGKSAARFSLRDGSTLALLIWKEADGDAIPHDPESQRAFLRDRFGDCRWEVPAMLARLELARDIYFDRVSQIEIDRWHKRRIALLGDAAFAPSFLAGQGSALAMIGAYVMAGEFEQAHGDIAAGLAAYQARLMPFMRAKQKAARGMAGSFVPSTRIGLALRALVSHLLGIGPVADMFIGPSVRDKIELPDYGMATSR
ncbi:FAD-binding domain [Tsuneonella mangrovi]|uniref:FAD-binding domain n=1 Tax=Tsuneonella mangrovi TaxID=1982042 RepID=UPI000BA219A7|nr:FAD-binding domain [Tsuneonella mangrovi]